MQRLACIEGNVLGLEAAVKPYITMQCDSVPIRGECDSEAWENLCAQSLFVGMVC